MHWHRLSDRRHGYYNEVDGFLGYVDFKDEPGKRYPYFATIKKTNERRCYKSLSAAMEFVEERIRELNVASPEEPAPAPSVKVEVEIEIEHEGW